MALEKFLVEVVARDDLVEGGLETGFAEGCEPLNTVFLGAAAHAEKVRDTTVEVANRIWIEGFALQFEGVPRPAPGGPTAEVAFAVESDDGGIFKR